MVSSVMGKASRRTVHLLSAHCVQPKEHLGQISHRLERIDERKSAYRNGQGIGSAESDGEDSDESGEVHIVAVRGSERAGWTDDLKVQNLQP